MPAAGQRVNVPRCLLQGARAEASALTCHAPTGLLRSLAVGQFLRVVRGVTLKKYTGINHSRLIAIYKRPIAKWNAFDEQRVARGPLSNSIQAFRVMPKQSGPLCLGQVANDLGKSQPQRLV